MLVRSLQAMVAVGCLVACEPQQSMDVAEEGVVVRFLGPELDPNILPSEANIELFGELYGHSAEEDPEFREAVLAAADELLPLAMACLSRDGVHYNFSEPSFPENRWVGRNRMRGAILFRFLREEGRGSVPDLMELLEDGRNWDGRHEVACAFHFMGPSGSAVLPIAMRDLESEDTHIRQHALRILGGVGGRSVEALSALKRSARSNSSDEVSESVWGLKSLMEDQDSDARISAEAKAHLIALAKGSVDGAYEGSVSARFALGFSPDSTQERVSELIEGGVLDPESPNYLSHIREILGPEDAGVY